MQKNLSGYAFCDSESATYSAAFSLLFFLKYKTVAVIIAILNVIISLPYHRTCYYCFSSCQHVKMIFYMSIMHCKWYKEIGHRYDF